MIVGLDFDNTIASYDDVMFETAVSRGLVDAATAPIKRLIRDRVRTRPEGEIEWQKLQGLVYGPLMAKATLIEGVQEFIRECRARQWAVYIVSHKTEYAGHDDTRTSLREASLQWMRQHGFFDAAVLGLDASAVLFEDTRAAILRRIETLGCTHFVDDLAEVLCEPEFPPGVERILFAPDRALDTTGPIKVVPDWHAMRDYFFASDRA